MLEDDPDDNIVSEAQTTDVHQKNFVKIRHCIDLVEKYVDIGERSIAIKLTAFISSSFIVSAVI